MREGWEKKKLGDICSFVRGPFGGSLKKNIFKKEGYAVYEQQHAIYDQFEEIRYFVDETKFNEMKRFELNSGELIMSCSGTMGKIAIVPQNIKKGIINQALLKLTPSKKISTIFLKLWMQSENFQESLKEYSGGAAIQNVASVAILKQIEIPLPPLPEQQRIVAILDECFAALEKAKANAQQNLKNAKELFESYLQGVFENKGEGWESRELVEVCDQITDGSHFSPKSTDEDEYPYITVRDIDNDLIDFVNCKFINKTNYQSLLKNGCKPNKGDLLFSKDGTVGKVSLVDFEKDFVVLSSLAIISPKKDKLDSEFLKYILKNPLFLKKAIGMKTGAAIRRIILKNLKQIKISFPSSIKEQQTIVRQLDALRAETQKLEAVYQQKLADLEELKKSILQKAFAGELTGSLN
jgi:type I restriction enzyme S subunit